MILMYNSTLRMPVMHCLMAIVLIAAAVPAAGQTGCIAPQITSPAFTIQTPCQRGLAFTWVLTAEGDQLTYQWYSNTSNSNTGGTALSEETTGFFTPATQTAGTFYYYCVVTGACGTVTSTTAELTVKPAPVINFSQTDVLCAGMPTGSIDLTITGGVSPYTYAWLGTGTMQGVEDPTGLFAGGNSVLVTGANGCASEETIIITQPEHLALAEDHVDPLCFDDAVSAFTISATGGVAPYTGTGVFTQPIGSQSYTITDANGCNASITVVVTAPEQLIALAEALPITTAGGTTTITVSATGGNLPYSGTGTFVRGAGTHSFTIIDINGCTVTTTIVLTDPVCTLTASTSAMPIPCGAASTTVTVSASGGTAPYTGTGMFTRGPGTYSFVVTDSKGCTATATITINNASITVDAGPDRNLCNGPVLLTAIVSGASTSTRVLMKYPAGCNALSYRWICEGGGVIATTPTITVSQPGTYIVKVTDCNGCTDKDTIVVTGCPPVDPNKCYKLIARHSGKALTITGSSATNGAKAEQRSYTGGLNQVWKFEEVQGDYYKVINVSSGKVLEVAGGSTSNGASVQQWTWNGGNDQRWEIDKVNGIYYGIKARHSQKYMGVVNASSANGAKIEQRGNHAGEYNRQWDIREVGCPDANERTTELIVTTTATEDPDQSALAIIVQPNPSVSYFMITVQSNDMVTPVTIKLSDANGKLMLLHSKVNVNSTLRIDAGEWTSGIYFVEVIQGKQRKTAKLVKSN